MGPKIWLLTIAIAFGAPSVASVEDRPLKTALFDLAPKQTADGQPIAGIIPLITRALAEELDEPIEQATVSYGRMLRSLENGDIDFAIFFLSPKSREIADPLHVFYQLETTMIGASSLAMQTNTDVKLRLAYPRGIFFGTDLDTSTELEKLFSNDHQHSVNLLLSGRVDVIAGPKNLLFTLIDEVGDRENFQVLRHINTNRTALQFSKRSDQRHRLGDLGKAAQAIRDKGTLSKLLAGFPFNIAKDGKPPTE